MSVYLRDGKCSNVREFAVGVTPIVANTLVKDNAGVVEPCLSPIVDATLVGVALESASSGVVAVEMVDHRELISAYTGTGKSSLVATDLGTIFDINSGGASVNLDDTSGGCFKCSGYNNSRDEIFGYIVDTKKEI